MESSTATASERAQSARSARPRCAVRSRSPPDHPDRVAIRTKGDAFSITWEEYAQRVRAAAAGLAGLGTTRGDLVAIMLTNRPEFYLVDAAAMHLGPRRSRSTTPTRRSRSSSW